MASFAVENPKMLNKTNMNKKCQILTSMNLELASGWHFRLGNDFIGLIIKVEAD